MILEDAIVFDVDPSCADAAIAAPELSDMLAARTTTPLEKAEDVVRARIAAIFPDQPLPYRLSENCRPSPEMA
jgi:isocitrate lyase